MLNLYTISSYVKVWKKELIIGLDMQQVHSLGSAHYFGDPVYCSNTSGKTQVDSSNYVHTIMKAKRLQTWK